jgi:molybdate transport system substrate-binding protein
MRKIVARALLIFAASILTVASAPAGAAEIKLLSAVGVKIAIDAILLDFERASGHTVAAVYGSAADLKMKIDGGESFDVTILTPAQIEDLIKKGQASVHADLASAVIGLAIGAGATRPDISTNEKLKTFLLGVKSIAHGDPALSPIPVVYLYKMAAVMGITDVLRAKTVIGKPGEAASLVAKGEAEIGLGLSSEVEPVAGAQFVPLRPDDSSSYRSFAGAVAADAKNAEAARALLTFIQSPTSKEVFKSKGLMIP